MRPSRSILCSSCSQHKIHFTLPCPPFFSPCVSHAPPPPSHMPSPFQWRSVSGGTGILAPSAKTLGLQKNRYPPGLSLPLERGASPSLPLVVQPPPCPLRSCLLLVKLKNLMQAAKGKGVHPEALAQCGLESFIHLVRLLPPACVPPSQQVQIFFSPPP